MLVGDRVVTATFSRVLLTKLARADMNEVDEIDVRILTHSKVIT